MKDSKCIICLIVDVDFPRHLSYEKKVYIDIKVALKKVGKSV